MTNPRDTGRYDAITDTWIDQQVRIDFAWGNIPMQPNDDRGENTLDPELDSHIIATSGYQNFPAFTSGGVFDDTIANAVVPNLVGMTLNQVGDALTAAGLVGSQSLSTDGATSGNNGKVKSQAVAAGTSLNVGSTVAYVSYNYVVAGGPISGFNGNKSSVSMSWGSYMDGYVMYLQGRTVKPTVGSSIVISGSSEAGYNKTWNVEAVMNYDGYDTGGTAVLITGHNVMSSNASGGNWTYA